MKLSKHLLWLAAVVVVCAGAASMLLKPQARPLWQHPNVDGVEPGMTRDQPVVLGLMATRKVRFESKTPDGKGSLMVFHDESSVLYENSGRVAAIDAYSLNDGSQQVLARGEVRSRVEYLLGDRVAGTKPSAAIYQLKPGMRVAVFFDDHDAVKHMMLFSQRSSIRPQGAEEAVPPQ